VADSAEVGRLVGLLLATHDPASTSAVEFRGAQFDLGLAWVDFPVGLGGLGLEPSLQRVVHERLAAARAPLPFDDSPVSYAMAGPVIERYGTPEQKQAWLRPIFTGEQPCCQLFSEPGAGSDLAAIATKAVRSGAAWRVTGQKTWTTMAHQARWGLLLARSARMAARSANPREGMTFFLLDMTSPGVTVRPLRQITGDSEYNEVFLDDVEVPDAHRLGPAGGGWQVAMTTLDTERRAIGAGIVAGGGRAIDHALALWGELDSAGRITDRAIKADALVECWLDAEALRLMQEQAAAVADTAAGAGPAGLAPAMKLLNARVNQATAAVMMELMGPEGMLYPSGYDASRADYVNQYVNPQQYLLRSLSHSIGGGTSEIVRNIIGERVLGLPREPRSQ
jgi:alkylation response protein AidB-like acyl-CoA dehydrogenase